MGQVGLREGPITAACDQVAVSLHGRGGHTSRPQLTEDLTYALAKDSEVTAALMIAPRVTVSGPSLFNGFMGGAAGNETIGMRQMSLGLAYSQKF